MSDASRPTDNPLLRYVPRLFAEWDVNAPGRTWQRVYGALCFVDISGFTALTERLARKGRIGAEELTEVLNQVFGTMMRLSEHRGGSLVKFGGDALLVLFEGSEAGSQAVAAAIEMRSSLSDASRIETSVGAIHLRMSVGIHAGPIDFYRVGKSHLEVVLAGPTVAKTVELEGTADAGEILISEELAAELPSDAVGSPKGPGWLLRWRTPRVQGRGSPTGQRIDVAQSARCIALALRDHLRERAFESEHRMTTVGFVKYHGVSRVLAESGPDELAARLDELVCLIQREVDAEGLTFLNADIDADGGKVTMTAGVPVHREDGEGRMLRAARRIVDGNPPLPISVGISRGALFSTHVGTETRSVYTVMGDAINLAARLAAAAPQGSIYLSPGIAERSRTVFELGELEPIPVKGKAEPVRVLELGAEIGQQIEPAGADLPFVGREEPLAALRDAMVDIGQSRLSAIGIVGDVGAGKTRLVREALPASGGPTTLVFRGEAFAADNPYWVFRDPLRRLLGIERGARGRMAADLEESLGRAAPALSWAAPLLGDLLHIPMADNDTTEVIEPMFRPGRVADSLVELLETMAPGRLVTVVEDRHWIDDASLAVFERVMQAAAERPWLVVMTSRASLEEIRGSFDFVATLGRLSDREARELVIVGTEATPLHPHDLDSVVARAAGNPLFLTELVNRIRVSGDAGDLPESLEALVGAGIDRLDPKARLILRHASVLGRSFRRVVLRDLLDPDDLGLGPAEMDALGQYLEREGDQRLRFRNAVIRDVAYGSLSYRRRRALHARAAAVIERRAGGEPEGVAEFLAVHSALAGDYEGAWRYSVLAGDKARDEYANVEAAAQYRRAVDAASRLGDIPEDDLVDVWTSLARVLEESGMLEDARSAIGSALRHLGADPVTRADLHLQRARTWMVGGSFANAKRNITLGRKELDPSRGVDHRGAAARLDSLEAGIAMYEGRPRRALRAAEMAMENAIAAGDDDALARAYIALDWAHHMLGQSGKATHGDRALELLEGLGQMKRAADVMNNEGGYAYFAGRWDDAVEWYRRSQEASERAGNVIDAAYVRANIAEVMIGQRRTEEARAELDEAHRVLRAAGALAYLGFVELQLARLDLETGQLESARSRLEDLHRKLEASGDRVGSLEALVHLADALIRGGDPQRALTDLSRAEGKAREHGAMFASALCRVRSQAKWALGDAAGAAAEAERGLDAARGSGMAHEEAALLDWIATMAGSSGHPIDPEILQRADLLHRRLGIRPGPPPPGDRVTRS